METTPTRSETMRAIVQDQYCKPDGLSLRDVPVPTIDDTTVLVEMRAAAVNPYDWHLMTGTPYLVRLQNGLRAPKRATPGADIAGVVVAVGRHVSEFEVGDDVFGFASGSLAEYAAVGEKYLVKKPENVTFEQAAAVPLAGLSALQGLRDHGKLTTGDQVLINGAAGGIGTLGIQIAKSMGASVTAVCSTRNKEMVLSLGADRVIDYTVDDFIAMPDRYDVVLDNVANRTAAEMRQIVKPGGTLVAVTAPKDGQWVKPITSALKGLASFARKPQQYKSFIAKVNTEGLRTLSALLADGKLTPHIGARYPLAEAPDALNLIATGHAQGKIIVLP